MSLRTEESSQGLGSLEESSGVDSIIVGSVDRNINERLLEGIDESPSWWERWSSHFECLKDEIGEASELDDIERYEGDVCSF